MIPMPQTSGQSCPTTNRAAATNPYSRFKPSARPADPVGEDTGYYRSSATNPSSEASGNTTQHTYGNAQEDYIQATSPSASDGDVYECIDDHPAVRSHDPKPPNQVLEPQRPGVVNKFRKSLMPK